jgi:hypothetical protein
MKPVICILLLLGVFATAAGAGDSDTRTVVKLTPPQRAMVLTEMRQFLAGLQQITAALAQDDMERVAGVAHSLGSPMTHHMPADLKQALPEEFRKLGFSVHADFDQIALDAAELGDSGHTLSQLGETLSKCNACHDAYRIEK